MDVANQPAPVHVTHDVFHRSKCLRGVGLVVHSEENSGDNLDHQHHQRQRTKEVPEVEVLGRVILGQVLVPHLGQWETGINPVAQVD